MNSEFRIKQAILSIDTSKHDMLLVGLTIDGREVKLEEGFDFRKSQGVLPLIEKIMAQEGISFKDLSEIKVNLGPGSFTGVRVGVAIANTLGLTLQIPVNGNKIGKPVEPVYE